MLSSAADPFAFRPTGKDEASSVEVTWPDGKMASRSVASEEMNSVLEIPYPRDEDRLQDPAPLEVRKACGPHSQKSRPHPQPCGLKRDSQESVDYTSRTMDIFPAKGGLHNDPSICSLHNSITPTSLLLLTEILGYWQGKYFCTHSAEEENRDQERKKPLGLHSQL